MRMIKPTLVLLAVLAATLPAAATPALAQTPEEGPAFVPGELLVGFENDGERLINLPSAIGVREAARALRANRAVTYAVPNYIAHASAVPNDPGRTGKPKGWRAMQWNFLPCGSTCGRAEEPLNFEAAGGIDAIGAWRTIHRRGRASGQGVRVAVLDTGVAYRTVKPDFKKSPDFSPKQFLGGYDFVRGTKVPLDRDGHGTHVTGTIAERTDNGVALTGLAPAAKIIPVRVLDADGFGTARQITRGIRFAATHGADVINMSFEFTGSVDSCKQIRSVCKALRFATKRHGIVVAAAAGNSEGDRVAFPARAPRVIGVGRTTRDACVAAGSRSGDGLDLLAPGGGTPRVIECGDPLVRDSSDPIYQLTFTGLGYTKFGYPGYYQGTSMAAAHVTGVAAMVISSRVLGKHPSRAAIECQLEQTARDSSDELGQPYDQRVMGAGLVDAASAVRSRAAGC
jgi:serine protease